MTQAMDPAGMEGPTLSQLGLLEQTRRLIESGSVTEPETLAAIDGLASTIRDANRSRPVNLPSVTWEDVRDPPPRDWIIPGWLPAGQLTLLTGEGGKGKSRLAQHPPARTVELALSEPTAKPGRVLAAPDGRSRSTGFLPHPVARPQHRQGRVAERCLHRQHPTRTGRAG